MLKDDFYFVTGVEKKSDIETLYSISLNTKHLILTAHFPDNPIVPGACLVQIAKELMTQTAQLSIISIKNLKFLNIIRPESNAEIVFRIILNKSEEEIVNADVSVSTGEVINSKFSLRLKPYM